LGEVKEAPMNKVLALLARRTTWAFVLIALAVALVGWSTIPLLPTAGRGLALGYLALVLAGLVLRGSVYTVWLAGVVTVITPVALMLLAMVFTTGDARAGLHGLSYLYVAGSLGGLVLELLQQKRYVLEKPALVRRKPGRDTETVVRDGPLWHLGFLSRMFIGGLAGAALVTLIGSVLGDLTIGNATDPTALVWAVVAGSGAPAVWKLLSDMVLKRSNAVDEVLAALEQQATQDIGHSQQDPPPPQQNGQEPAPATPPPPQDLAVSMTRAMRKMV
jgi:hypothetical protein